MRLGSGQDVVAHVVAVVRSVVLVEETTRRSHARGGTVDDAGPRPRARREVKLSFQVTQEVNVSALWCVEFLMIRLAFLD